MAEPLVTDEAELLSRPMPSRPSLSSPRLSPPRTSRPRRQSSPNLSSLRRSWREPSRPTSPSSPKPRRRSSTRCSTPPHSPPWRLANAPEAPTFTKPEPVEAEPEPVAFVEPLDEILVGDSVAAETAEAAEAEPEAAWQAEPLDDIVVAEAAVEPVAESAPEPVVEVAAEPVIEAAPSRSPSRPHPSQSRRPSRSRPRSLRLPLDDVVAQPTWSILAPDPRPVTESPGPLADGPAPTIEPVPAAAQAVPPPSAEPSWPAQPQWPSAQSSAGLPFLGRPSVPTGGVDALWAESSQAVSAPLVGTDKPAGGVQPCTSCGLSLSASARFCRRCGTSQVG